MSTYGCLGLRIGVLLLLVSGCRDATQLTVEVRTRGFACTDGSGSADAGTDPIPIATDILIGRPGELETTSGGKTKLAKEATIGTTQCAGDRVGTLVVVPSGEKDEAVELLVVAGAGQQASSCSPDPQDSASKRCFFVRTSVHFRPHENVPVQVVLDKVCLGNPCEPTTTCSNGACVPISEASPP